MLIAIHSMGNYRESTKAQPLTVKATELTPKTFLLHILETYQAHSGFASLILPVKVIFNSFMLQPIKYLFSLIMTGRQELLQLLQTFFAGQTIFPVF